MLEASNAVKCSVCYGDLDYSVLADAILVRKCKNRCGGSIIITRTAMEDAIKDMNVSEVAEKVASIMASEGATQ
ncbi:MAG: hypothetical protein E3K36_04300 [Candidatus Brocadia sp.]|nr:hypothetical protein [Candidatus Brocadia sp.]